MLAAIPQDIPLREHSHLDFQHSSQAEGLALEEKLCPGCKNSVVNEQGGLVVAFGQSFFHVDCFKCAKCRNQVTADTNLLLLSDGSPICANCSYSCNICHLPILDEAIMTGDDSYHAHCFKCKVCSNRIDELVFAKTSQGIYCMNCHNERMIKIRKHAQKKAERERANGGSGSSRSREHDARNFHRNQEKSSANEHRQPNESWSPPGITSSRSESSRAPETLKPSATSSPSASKDPSDTVSPPPYLSPTVTKTTSESTPHSTSIPPTVTSLTLNEETTTKSLKGISSESLISYNATPAPLEQERKSSDASRLNIVHEQDPGLQHHGNFRPSALPSTEGLSVTSRRDKRRSINPAISVSQPRDFSSNQAPGMASRQGSLPIFSGSPSGHPQQLVFSTDSTSRTPSRSNSLQSSYSPSRLLGHDQTLSRTSEIHADSQQDDTITIKSVSYTTSSTEGPDDLVSTMGERSPAPSAEDVVAQRSSATLSPTDTYALHSSRRTSLASNRSAHQSASNSRSVSPIRADVPRDVDSGTDTDADNGNESDNPGGEIKGLLPPALPPKDVKDPNIESDSPSTENMDEFDYLESFHNDTIDASDDATESLSMERMSHSTFIAPALPPIRFSLNPADFSDLLNSVGGLPPIKSLENLSKLTKQAQDNTPSTPPPTASSFNPHHLSREPKNDWTNSESGDMGVPITHGTSYSLSTDVPNNINDSESSPLPRVTGSRRSYSEADALILKLREALASTKEKGAKQLNLDIDLVDSLMEIMESRNAQFERMKNKVDGMNRDSKLIIDGLTVAQEEYDRELKARRDAEAEVTRLRVLLSGQAVRLTALSGDNRRQEIRQKLSKELNDNLYGLEHDLSRLKVERDMTLAEMEELTAKRSVGNSPEVAPTNLGRSLTKRLETIRSQYQRELVPLTEQKEILNREIAELRAVRDVFLEETTVLNARNEELAQLSAVYSRRMENANTLEPPAKEAQETLPVSLDIVRTQSQSHDDHSEPRSIKSYKSENELHSTSTPRPKFKWPGSKAKETASPSNFETTKGKAHIEHNFQQLSILRFTRCDHCGDKMWGSQLRCTVCSTSIHVRCIANVQISCTQQNHLPREENIPLPPSMFGRDLTEQVHADSRNEDRDVPVIVEKCIEAVEERALDYEGIYRKTGGSGQTKAITQLFERGDYASFDLCDSDRFNDICSITSVLKTYFRSLPIPLLTFDLHDDFTSSIAIKDASLKFQSLSDLVHRLPDEHYYTLRMLMLHLNRVLQRSERNLMTARNLGVVFGPTLMRSRDPGAEFSDMAGKALFIEWLVENAPDVFNDTE